MLKGAEARERPPWGIASNERRRPQLPRAATNEQVVDKPRITHKGVGALGRLRNPSAVTKRRA